MDNIPFGTTLGDVVATFSRWLHLPDPSPLYAVLGTVAANRLDGDPVWLLLVGPPGGGKTELLTALSACPTSTPAATLTEAALAVRHAEARARPARRAASSGRSVTSGSSSARTSARSSR